MDKNTVFNINVVAKEKGMTLKEKIDLFCAKEVVLHVPTKDLFIKVCKELKARGSWWFDGAPVEFYSSLWNKHCGKTVIGFYNEKMVVENRDRFNDRIVIIITEDDFKLKESTAQQVAKAVLESAKKRAGKKDPLDAMCGGIEKVTFVATHGDSRTFYVKTSKEGDTYIIQEVDIPKFAKGEKFTDENGVLGRIDDIHDRTYDCEMVTGEKYALRIDEADKKFKKITW